MKHFILTILFSLLNNFIWAQPFATGTFSKTFQDPARSNRSVTTEIYYPADAAGTGVPVAVNGGAFPVVVFGHGFVMTWSAYENIWLPLTAAGYVVVFPTTESGFSPSHTEFAKDIAFLVTALQNEGLDPGSILFNRIGTTSAVMGHSMGGGSSFLAVQYNPSITAVANLAAAETNPSAVAACANIQIPVLMFAGGNDCVTPPPNHQDPMYSALSSSCKAYISITGGSHCQFANYNFNCSFGELTCSPSPTITRAAQQAIVNQLLIPWLDYHLKSDCNQGTLFESLVANPAGFTVQKNCMLCSTSLAGNSVADPQFTIATAATDGFLQVRLTGRPLKNVEVMMYDQSGKRLHRQQFDIGQNEIVKIPVDGLVTGIYLVRLSGDDFVPVTGRFLKL